MKILNAENPLWMPKGSVRALLALMFTGATIYGWLTGAEIKEILAVTAFILGFYFKARS